VVHCGLSLVPGVVVAVEPLLSIVVSSMAVLMALLHTQRFSEGWGYRVAIVVCCVCNCCIIVVVFIVVISSVLHCEGSRGSLHRCWPHKQ